jgi:Asp-tRNA(Asn)/Glu-tRNA(Gln) amidotransferase B subunit
MTEKKKGRGRPKGSTNKPLMELSTERRRLTNDASVFAILEQCNIVEDDDKAANGLQHYAERNGAVLPVLQWIFDKNIVSRLPEGKTPYTPNPAPAEDLTEMIDLVKDKKNPFKRITKELVDKAFPDVISD